MTIAFRRLADLEVNAPSLDILGAAFYNEEKRRAHEPEFRHGSSDTRIGYASTDRRTSAALACARQPALRAPQLPGAAGHRSSEQGDPGAVGELLEVLRRPYDDQPAPRLSTNGGPDWAKKPGRLFDAVM
jgi:hypothetical protein